MYTGGRVGFGISHLSISLLTEKHLTNPHFGRFVRAGRNNPLEPLTAAMCKQLTLHVFERCSCMYETSTFRPLHFDTNGKELTFLPQKSVLLRNERCDHHKGGPGYNAAAEMIKQCQTLALQRKLNEVARLKVEKEKLEAQVADIATKMSASYLKRFNKVRGPQILEVTEEIKNAETEAYEMRAAIKPDFRRDVDDCKFIGCFDLMDFNPEQEITGTPQWCDATTKETWESELEKQNLSNLWRFDDIANGAEWVNLRPCDE